MDLDLTRIFVKVIQNGSFSKTASLLKMPKSSVSKAMARLEKELGTKLILRTTRSLTLTASGRAFYEATLGPLQSIEEAQKSLFGHDNILSGQLKITAPEDLGSQVIAPAMAELTLVHPELSFDLQYTDEVLDLVKEGIDIAVRLGRVNESRFKVKRAGHVVLILVASPQYLQRREKIKHPSEIEGFDCISYNDQAYNKWILRSGRESAQIMVKARITSNQMSSLLRAALAGAGIALIPAFLCLEHLKDGRLVHILPAWNSPPIPVSVISPLAPSSSVRLKVTVDRILSSLSLALHK